MHSVDVPLCNGTEQNAVTTEPRVSENICRELVGMLFSTQSSLTREVLPCLAPVPESANFCDNDLEGIRWVKAHLRLIGPVYVIPGSTNQVHAVLGTQSSAPALQGDDS
jgi:hypothetical protein